MIKGDLHFYQMVMKVNFHYAFICEHLVSFLSITDKRGSNFHRYNFPNFANQWVNQVNFAVTLYITIL